MNTNKGNFKISNLTIKSIKNRSVHTLNNKRRGYFTVEKAIKLLRKNKNKKAIFDVSGVRVRGTSKKHNVFLKDYNHNLKTCVCGICGKQADYAVLEKIETIKNNIHNFNLYRIDPITNVEILFNVDHIKPTSKGGENLIGNKTITCQTCNSEKADKYNENLFDKIKNYFTNLFK